MKTKNNRLERVEKEAIIKSISSFMATPLVETSQARGVFSPESLSSGTEGHHASHALTFFSYMAYNAAKGKSIKQHLLKRLISHLMALREFIERPELNNLVRSLVESVAVQYGKFHEDAEQSAESIALWLERNQEDILMLAELYGKQSVFVKLLPVKGSVGSGEVKGTAIRDLRDRYLVEEEQMLGKLFVGYFNNKMAVLVFLIQAQKHKPDTDVVSSLRLFLDDLFHHMLDGCKQGHYRRVFLWLKRFLAKLPNVQLDQRRRAVRFVQDLYGVFGVHLNSNLRGDENEKTKKAV